MAARSGKLAWLAVAVLAVASIAGGVMLRMKAPRSSSALLPQPSPSPRPVAAPNTQRADASISDANTPAPVAPTSPRDGGIALSSEAALLREIETSVKLGRIGHARSLADRFYRAFPGSPEIPRIERLTGYHPRPYGPPQR
jgi:hypothetical protein